MLTSYIQHIKSALSSYAWIESVDFLRFDVSETDHEKILLYRIRIHCTQGKLLEAFERVTEKNSTKILKTTKYHFHWQGLNNQLLRRWDNAPHHPEIETFPDHVHLGPENICRAGEPSSLPAILEEIDRLSCEKDQEKDGR